MLWLAGAMSGTGSTNISTGAVLYLLGNGRRTLNGRPLNILGSEGAQGGGSVFVGNQEFTNKPSIAGNNNISGFGDISTRRIDETAYDLAGELHTWLFNPPQPPPGQLGLGLTLERWLAGKSAIVRAAMAVAYNSRYHNAPPVRASSNYFYYGQAQHPNPANQPLSVDDYLDLSRGIASGLLSGAWAGLTDLPVFLYKLVTDFSTTVNGIMNGLTGLIDQIRRGDGLLAAAQTLFPELYQLATTANLTPYDKGFLVGKFVGKYFGQMGQAALLSASISAIALPIMRRLTGPGLLSVGAAANQILQVEARLVGRFGQGARDLLAGLESNAINIRKGAQFQAARALYYESRGQLKAIETNLRIGRGRPDLRLTNGTLVECKNWPGWIWLSNGAQKDRIDRLKNQIKNYLENPNNTLILEFADSIPSGVQAMINGLADNIKNRITIPRPIPFPQ